MLFQPRLESCLNIFGYVLGFSLFALEPSYHFHLYVLLVLACFEENQGLTLVLQCHSLP